MAEKDYTFEDIDRLVSTADLATFKAGGRYHFTAETVRSDLGGVIQSVCGIYKIVRPILVVLSNLPLIPTSWREVIKTFVGLMDSLCQGK